MTNARRLCPMPRGAGGGGEQCAALLQWRDDSGLPVQTVVDDPVAVHLSSQLCAAFTAYSRLQRNFTLLFGLGWEKLIARRKRKQKKKVGGWGWGGVGGLKETGKWSGMA